MRNVRMQIRLKHGMSQWFLFMAVLFSFYQERENTINNFDLYIVRRKIQKR